MRVARWTVRPCQQVSCSMVQPSTTPASLAPGARRKPGLPDIWPDLEKASLPPTRQSDSCFIQCPSFWRSLATSLCLRLKDTRQYGSWGSLGFFWLHPSQWSWTHMEEKEERLTQIPGQLRWISWAAGTNLCRPHLLPQRAVARGRV